MEAPAAPTGLTATTSEWDANTLAATWTAAADNGGATETPASETAQADAIEASSAGQLQKLVGAFRY